MDDHIRASAAAETIQEIFSQFGEAHFRQLESEAAAAAATLENAVISTGGGVIGREDNMRTLSSGNALVVYLETSFEEAKRRVSQDAEDTERPLFADDAAAKQLLADRDPEYRRFADVVIATDGKSVEQVRDAILGHSKVLTAG